MTQRVAVSGAEGVAREWPRGKAMQERGFGDREETGKKAGVGSVVDRFPCVGVLVVQVLP